MIKLLREDYIKRMPRKHKKNCKQEVGHHVLTGGEFMYTRNVHVPFLMVWVEVNILFTDHCSCPVVDRCELELPLYINLN
jgi:hypothetical protein